MQHAPFIVDRGEGIYVFDEQGRRYLDAASLALVHERWLRTRRDHRRDERTGPQASCLPQLHRLRHASFARPCSEIASVAPDPDSKVFFASGGSDAVDTAAKMARRYFSAIGEPSRTVFIAREWAYHGMHTYGTSLGGMEPNRIGYGGDLVTDVVFVPYDDAEAVEKAIDHVGDTEERGQQDESITPACDRHWLNRSRRSRGWR